jgi:hypothetical protein
MATHGSISEPPTGTSTSSPPIRRPRRVLNAREPVRRDRRYRSQPAIAQLDRRRAPGGPGARWKRIITSAATLGCPESGLVALHRALSECVVAARSNVERSHWPFRWRWPLTSRHVLVSSRGALGRRHTAVSRLVQEGSG